MIKGSDNEDQKSIENKIFSEEDPDNGEVNERYQSRPNKIPYMHKKDEGLLSRQQSLQY